MRKSRMIYGVFALSLASASCVRQQKIQARAYTPPPPRIYPTVEATVPQLPQAPEIVTNEASTIPPPLPDEPFPELPDAPKRAPRRITPTIVAPKPPAAPPPVEPTVTPRLSQILTAEEVRENSRTLAESLERVNRALSSLEGKNLTGEQKDEVERIRTFRKQAEQAREQDLLTAVSLARRADLLAKDLLERLP